MRVDLGDLGFDQGGALLVKRAIRMAGPGAQVAVSGTAPELRIHLRAWCRQEGHKFEGVDGVDAIVTIRSSSAARWSDAERAGAPDPAIPDAVVERPPQRWGLAARGALVERGSPEFAFLLDDKMEVWSGDAGRIYAQGAASQWDPATAIPWGADFDLPAEVEDAVVQIMTFLIENETAALLVPSRFLSQLHPHFREVMQVLALQAADEARHIEVFTRRAVMKRPELGFSSADGQASLKTLIEQPDFAVASFLLSVLGEGTFLSLLWFIERYAPDPVTAAVCRLAAQDEARHVAFGMAHLRQHIALDPGILPKLASAVRDRHLALQNNAGLNAEVFDALLLIAAGAWELGDLSRGHHALMDLVREMDDRRQSRMIHLGFSDREAEELSKLHTRNFM